MGVHCFDFEYKRVNCRKKAFRTVVPQLKQFCQVWKCDKYIIFSQNQRIMKVGKDS